MSNSKPEVIYWNSIPSPYFVSRLNAVAQRENVIVEAWFNEIRTPERSWDVSTGQWDFSHRFVKRSSKGPLAVRLPLAAMRQKRPDVFISLFSDPSFVLGHLAASAFARRTAFRVLPTFDAWVKRSPARELVKHLVYRNVDAVKVPGEDGAELAGHYGVPSDRIFRVTQSVDFARIRTQADLRTEERNAMRESLGVSGFTFIYVGRLWQKKGLGYLLSAFAELRKVHPNSSLLLVGDGIDEDYFRAKWSGHPGVVFVGFVQPVDLPKYFGIADALVFPTLGDPNGLVVEEAMSASLPVLSTTSAGDISRRISDGITGFVVPPASSEALLAGMTKLVSNPEAWSDMGRRGFSHVENMTHERYAVDFETMIEAVLMLPKRQNAIRLGSAALGRIVPMQQ